MRCYCQNKPGNWLSKVNPGIGFVHKFEELTDNLLGKRAKVSDSAAAFVFLRSSLPWPEVGFGAAREPGVQEADDSGTWSLWWWEGWYCGLVLVGPQSTRTGKEKLRAVRVCLRRQASGRKATRAAEKLSCPVTAGTHPGSQQRPEWQMAVQMCSVVSDSATRWTVAGRALLSTGFSRHECCSGLPFLPPGDLPDPGTEPASSAWQVDSFPLSHLATVKNQTEAEDFVLLKPLISPSGSGRPLTCHLGQLLSHQIYCNAIPGWIPHKGWQISVLSNPVLFTASRSITRINSPYRNRGQLIQGLLQEQKTRTTGRDIAAMYCHDDSVVPLM